MNIRGKFANTMVALTLLGLPAWSLAGEGMIMLTGDCPYMVLDTDQGQALVKRVSGTAPETGDILEGPYDSKEFATLTNQSTREELEVWVDVVDRHGHRALSRHGRYCR